MFIDQMKYIVLCFVIVMAKEKNSLDTKDSGIQ